MYVEYRLRAQVFHWLSSSLNHWIWTRRGKITLPWGEKKGRHEPYRARTSHSHFHIFCGNFIDVGYSEEIFRKYYLIFDRFCHDEQGSGSRISARARKEIHGNAGSMFYWFSVAIFASGESEKINNDWLRQKCDGILLEIHSIGILPWNMSGNQMENWHIRMESNTYAIRNTYTETCAGQAQGRMLELNRVLNVHRPNKLRLHRKWMMFAHCNIIPFASCLVRFEFTILTTRYIECIHSYTNFPLENVEIEWSICRKQIRWPNILF